MHLAACLQPPKLARLKDAAGSRHVVHAATDWAHVDSIIRRQPVDVLLVDPQFGAGAASQTDRIRAVRDKYRSLPMIVYSTLGTSTHRELVELGKSGMEHLVLFGMDDDPSQLRALLDRQPGTSLAETVLTLLQRPLSRAPAMVATAIDQLLRNPAAFADVADLAIAASSPRRSLYRHCERAGFVTPKELLSGARLLRAYAYLREPSYTLESVATHVGFGDSDALAKAMKWGVGTTPARARDRMGPEEFAARLATTLAPGIAIETGSWLNDDARGRLIA